MLSARQLLLMRRARDRAIDSAIAPLGTVILLPDPDLRGRVFRCVGHVEAHICRSIGWPNGESGERGLSDLHSPTRALRADSRISNCPRIVSGRLAARSLRVMNGKALNEQITSGLPATADIAPDRKSVV